MRDSFIFYRSFFEATKPLNEHQKAQLFDAICEFALNQNETKIEPMVNAMFGLIRPQLEANSKKYENGKKGGRPKTKAKPKANQTKTKPKPNVNDNVNDNVNVNDTKVPKEINSEAFDEWLNYKKYKAKAPITKAINLMKQYSKEEQQEMVDHSIMSGYKGLFAPKGNNGTMKQLEAKEWA